MSPTPVVALLGAAAGVRQTLARDLIERLAQCGIGAGLAPQITCELSAGSAHPTLTLLIASEDGDHGLRERLARERIAYSVLCGNAADRLAGAWQLLKPLLNLPQEPAAPEPTRRAWRWACDKCSDPACEHRLLQDLLAGRSGTASGTDPVS